MDPQKPVTLIVAEMSLGNSISLTIMWCLHGTLFDKDEQTICVDSVKKNPRAQAKVKMKVIHDKASYKTSNFGVHNFKNFY